MPRAERADASAKHRPCLDREMTSSRPADDGNLIDCDQVNNCGNIGGDRGARQVRNRIGSAVAETIR
jgi:hypothetical protein